MKRLLAFGVVVALVGGAVFVGANLPLGTSDDSATAAATPIVPVSTATIVQRTIESTEEFDGTLGYAGEGVIISGLNGTYTKLPEAGDILTLGDEIYEVNGTQSSYLMYGNRPAYRPLDIDSENGPDVKQLEASLKQIGFPNLLGRGLQAGLELPPEDRERRREVAEAHQPGEGRPHRAWARSRSCPMTCASPRSCRSWAPARRPAASWPTPAAPTWW